MDRERDFREIANLTRLPIPYSALDGAVKAATGLTTEAWAWLDKPEEDRLRDIGWMAEYVAHAAARLQAIERVARRED